MDRKAYYNLLLLQSEKELNKLPCWQVDDYRSLEMNVLFDLLEELEVTLDQHSFLDLASQFDHPEEIVEEFIDPKDQDVFDRVYLIIFELWRRLVPEKMTLAFFCDELDTQIFFYDKEDVENYEGIENALSHLEMVLDENSDQGQDPKVVFQSINKGCAHDLESFLYDYIAEQIDQENSSFVEDLIDAFQTAVSDRKWFDLLRFQLAVLKNQSEAIDLLPQLLEIARNENDIDFDLELLQTLVQGGDQKSFDSLFCHALGLIEIEEDFQELLMIARDFYTCIDCEEKERLVDSILQKRAHLALNSSIKRDDIDVNNLF